MRRIGIVTLGFALVPFLMMSTPGCRSEADSTSDSTSTEAFKASSPACTAARDACRAQTDPLVAAIKTACAQVQVACAHVADHRADGGGAATADASTLSCDDARAACNTQITMSKAALQAAGQSCEASIRTACTVNRGADGGSPADAGTPASPDASIGPSDGGGADAAGADACKAAQQSCHQQLGQIRSMPPAECASAQAACTGQGLLDISDACKTASSACQAALQSTLTSTLDSCGTAIVSACSRRVH